MGIITVTEVKIGKHRYSGVNHGVQMCEGVGMWSSKGTDHIVIAGSNELSSIWSAECPQCRKVIDGVEVRNRLLVKETIVGALNKIKDIVRRG